MKNGALAALAIVLSITSPSLSAQTITARRVASELQENVVVLPSNTEINIRLNEELNTKSNEQGDMVNFSVTHDVVVDGYVAIPQGSRAVGEITWMTGKGMFGKSGKFDLELRYLEVEGRRIALNGKFRQEGDGNTVATVGAVVVVPVVGFFVTGKSGEMPRGRELTVFTAEPVPVRLAD